MEVFSHSRPNDDGAGDTILVPREYTEALVEQMRRRYVNEAQERAGTPEQAGWIADGILAGVRGLPKHHEIDLERAQRNVAHAEEYLKSDHLNPRLIAAANSAKLQLERVLRRIGHSS